MSEAMTDLRAVSVTLIVRHSADCAHKDDPQYKRCDCWKHLRYYDKTKKKMRWEATKQRTWAGAERVRHEFEQKHDPTRRTEQRPHVTVRDAIDTFIEGKRGQNLDEKTCYRYRLELDRLHTFLETTGVFNLEDVKLRHLISFRATWTNASSTRDQMQGRLKAFFKSATNLYELPRNPVVGLEAIIVDSQQTQPYSPAEYQAILEAVPTAFEEANPLRLRMLALIKLMRWSGLAVIDAFRLQRSGVQRRPDGVALIVTERKKNERKKRKVRVCVPVPEEVVEALAAVTNSNPKYIFWDGVSDLVQATNNLQGHFRRVFDEAGINDGHSHRLRDTAAVEWLKSKKVSLWQVSKLLGHTNINTTQKHYAPWVTELQDQMEEAVISTWEKKPEPEKQ